MILAGAHLIAGQAIDDLKEDLDTILTSSGISAHIGVEIVSLKTGQRLYGKDSDKLFVPASTLKVFTGAAALAILGVDYRFETKLFLDDQGNLYLKGGGDPTLVSEAIEQFALQLKMRGITAISGKVYVDNSEFDAFPMGPGWMWDEPAEFWNSPMDALMVNHSALSVYVAPAIERNQPPRVFLQPPVEGFIVDNLAITGPSNTLQVNRRSPLDDVHIEVRGSVPTSLSLLEIKLPVAKPAIFGGEVLVYYLKRHGISVKGGVENRQVPMGVQEVSVHVSPPLSEIVRTMLKKSDNLYADTLFKKIGRVCLGAPGTWQKGSQAMREFLKRDAAIDPDEMVILDGSGLSRYNLFSPKQCVQLLGWIYQAFPFSAEFLSGLPISGVDGTLSRRMGAAKGRVRAKSGTMAGISGISGFVTTLDGEICAFAILANGFIGPAKTQQKELEDAICLRLASFKR